MGHAQPGSNPFAYMANGQNYQQPPVAIQPTGFILPQQTAVPQQSNPFGIFLGQQPQQQPAHRPFSSYITSQPTGFQQVQQPQMTGFPQQRLLQPQPTGVNPFRQTMLIPQSTGMALFDQFGPNGQRSSQGTPATSLSGVSAFSQSPMSIPVKSPTPSMGGISSNNMPARPSSTPLTSSTITSQPLQLVTSHQTGTKNPFGPITIPPPPVPKAPTLLELTTGMAAMNGNVSQSQQSAHQQLPQQQTDSLNKFSFNNSTLNPGATDISSIASSFAFNPNAVGSATGEKSTSSDSGFMGSQGTGATAASSALSDSLFSSTLSQSTKMSTLPPSPTMQGSPPVVSHVTGFAGLKPFVPSSSFGASLMESLSPIAGSGSTNPTTNSTPNAGNGLATPPDGANNLSSFSPSTGTGNYSFLNSQPTGATGGFSGASSTFKSSLGVGLRPQMTGGGTANPFRASSAGGPGFGAPASFQSMGSSQPFGANMFGMTGGTFGAQGQQPQPHGTAS